MLIKLTIGCKGFNPAHPQKLFGSQSPILSGQFKLFLALPVDAKRPDDLGADDAMLPLGWNNTLMLFGDADTVPAT
jgi:hypothetical protein